MGLDTTHNAWHGAYSSFWAFRNWLAQKRGFDLNTMYGFGGMGVWTIEQQADPLYPLLDHSDCDGILTVEECRRVAEGLNQIIVADPPEAEKWLNDKAIQFRNGCLEAIEENEPIEFH